MVAGIVVGVAVAIVGAAANYVVTTKRKKERWKREDKFRYHADRILAYARFMRTTQLGFPLEFSNPPTADELNSISDGLAETLILSTPPVHDAALELYDAHARIRGVQIPEDDTEAGPPTNPQEFASQKREAFLEAVRAELGIVWP